MRIGCPAGATRRTAGGNEVTASVSFGSPPGRGGLDAALNTAGRDEAAAAAATALYAEHIAHQAAQPTQASPLAIDGRYLVVALGPVAPPKPRGLYVCGQLTALNLATGNLSQLPFPIQCSTAAPPSPLQVAW
jgi:hypothetical protein